MTIVETRSGRVQGTRAGGVTLFAGIPYAEPPLGPLRFRSPRRERSWTGAREAMEFGSIAVQKQNPNLGYRPPMSEDCLVLDVWTPSPDGARRPVMVWLHGGAYSGGMGRMPQTDGALLAREQDVVVVTVNHRLGVLGFLRTGFLDEDGRPDTDNVGMLDIIAALEWIRDDIEAFGGDPANVTLFGASGGGWKISTLLAMPAARGLFHKGIIQSGSQLRATPLDVADEAAAEVLRLLGAESGRVDDAHQMEARRLVEIAGTRYETDFPGRFQADGTFWWDMALSPAVDGRTLPREPFRPDAPPEAEGVPLMIGATRDEIASDWYRPWPWRFLTEPEAFEDVAAGAASLGLDRAAADTAVEILRGLRPAGTPADIFNDLLADTLFFMNAVRQLEAQATEHSAPLYAYRFDWRSPSSGGVAGHGDDVPFVFGGLREEERDDPSAIGLAANVSAAWATFARTGDPSHAGIPVWPRYDLERRATMLLDRECTVASDPLGDLRRTLSDGGADPRRART